MNVEIDTEAAEYLVWECINGIFVAVQVLGQGALTCAEPPEQDERNGPWLTGPFSQFCGRMVQEWAYKD